MKDINIDKKNDFIDILKSMTPEQMNEFISKKGNDPKTVPFVIELRRDNKEG